jgi:hypothetical protein
MQSSMAAEFEVHVDVSPGLWHWPILPFTPLSLSIKTASGHLLPCLTPEIPVYMVSSLLHDDLDTGLPGPHYLCKSVIFDKNRLQSPQSVQTSDIVYIIMFPLTVWIVCPTNLYGSDGISLGCR